MDPHMSDREPTCTIRSILRRAPGIEVEEFRSLDLYPLVLPRPGFQAIPQPLQAPHIEPMPPEGRRE